ncbi:hypothetical protein WA588_001764, partial [Blastocystis sp. NMH]
MLGNSIRRTRPISVLLKRNAHVYAYMATSKETDFAHALKECIDDISSNFSAAPTLGIMFSSHKRVDNSQMQSFYSNNKWLNIGCMVPSISDDPNVHMCISGLLVEGDDKGIVVTNNLTAEAIKRIQNSDCPSLFFKSFTSPSFPALGKMKVPAGLVTSRNSSALHDPEVIDTCWSSGSVEKSAVCVQFKKDLFRERSIPDFLGPSFSLLHPYLCSFNLPFWNSLFPPLTPQVVSSPRLNAHSPLPLLKGLALVFPLSTTTLYIYQPNHLYMLRKNLHSSFIITPPNHSEVGTICHIEEIVSVGEDGAILCKVHGDSKVFVTKQYHITSEMGSMMGNIAPAQDLEGDSVCDTNSESWETMLRVREEFLRLYRDKPVLDEIIKKYGSMPYHPRLFSYWLCNVMVAEGSQKEAWYALTSTKDRLEAIEHVLEKEKN